jgi:Tol biopolymer transport system component
MIRPDGTGNRRLLHAHRRSESGPRGPNWSPDGTKLLFFRGLDRENTSAGSLWYLTVATGQLRRIPLAVGRGRFMAGYDWAPDGRRLVVSLAKDCCNGMLYTLRVDGTHLKKLRRGMYPSWAGRHIAFELRGTMNVVRPNGTGFRRLSARSAHVVDFSFSPGGTKLVYYRSTPTSELRMVDVTGRNDVRLRLQALGASSPFRYPCGAPQWTPDGKRLAAVGTQYLTPDGASGAPTNSLVTFNLAGQDERKAFTFPRRAVGLDDGGGCGFSWQRAR